MAIFSSTQPPFFQDNDTDNIMSSNNLPYFQEASLPEIDAIWNDKIDPSLQSYSNQGSQAAYQYQLQQRLKSYIDAPPQRALFTAPSYNQPQYAQGVRSLPQVSIPYPLRNTSPALSHDFTSSTSTSGHSPEETDLSYYSPQQSHLQGGDDLHLRQGGFSQNDHELWSGNGPGDEMSYHVNMSQVQSFPDMMYEPLIDEEMHHHLSTSEGETHFPSEIQTYANYGEDRNHSQGRDEGTYFGQHTDQGLGTSVNTTASPAESTTAYEHEDDEDDEEYTPLSTRTRKRAALFQSHVSPQPSAKRVKSSHSAPKPKSKLKSTSTTGSHQCTTCTSSFPTSTILSRHIATAHTRPYTCVFSFAGCISTFASKNEWKRHVSSQHLCLEVWACTMGQCGKTRNGSEFNRKDLFTQHCRRMHGPAGNGGAVKGKGKDLKWEEELKVLQKKCLVVKREAPRVLRCPVRGCDVAFEGKGTWDERMEHVGRHLDKVSGDGEEVVRQGGEGDELLVEWAVKEGVVFRLSSGRYGFTKEGMGGFRGHSNISLRGGSTDMDAEGEIDDGYSG